MKYLLWGLALPLLMAGDCQHKKKSGTGNADIPSCVQQLIDEAKNADPPVTPVRVEEYEYRGKKAYLFTAPCCDLYNILYDENCQRICAPSGGFTGGGDRQCTDFDSTAKKIKLIWSAP